MPAHKARLTGVPACMPARHAVAQLSLVDLAGSERAAETNNAGQKLRDGANINR